MEHHLSSSTNFIVYYVPRIEEKNYLEKFFNENLCVLFFVNLMSEILPSFMQNHRPKTTHNKQS